MWQLTAIHGDATYIVYEDRRYTYAQTHAIVNAFAAHLVSLGVKKGDRVAIAMRNCPAWIVSYMAILKTGAVATLLNGWWEAH